jgi:MFS family permease
VAPPVDQRLLYRYLELESFSNEELSEVFDRMMSISRAAKDEDTITEPESLKDSDESHAILTEDILRDFLIHRYQQLETVPSEAHSTEIQAQRHSYATQQAQDMLHLLNQHHNSAFQLDKEQFRQAIVKIATSVSYGKSLPVVISMFMVGTSVGVISPVMPFIVEQLGLTAGQYGMVVSAFALSKMAGNVPSAVLVDRHGRKPYMVYSLSIIAIGTGGVGLAHSFEELYLCRLLVGLGVAALSSASTMTVADISTPKNRARTYAPIMSAFAAGAALGPAIGGYLADEVGIRATFYVVGASFMTMTLVNSMLLSETKQKPITFPWELPSQLAASEIEQKSQTSMWDATKQALGQWAPLLSTPKIRNVIIINGFYWVALAGAQMTLLPLLLTDPNGLAMTASQVGQVYMGMSIVQVLGNPIAAKYVDRIGKVPAMLAGCTLISAGMATLPFGAAHDFTSLAAALGVWATGSTLLSTAPVSYISDSTEESNRAQAIALLRTSGDVGFLVGASAVGALADWTGNLDIAMQASAGVLLTATSWFGVRQMMQQRIKNVH